MGLQPLGDAGAAEGFDALWAEARLAEVFGADDTQECVFQRAQVGLDLVGHLNIGRRHVCLESEV